jgi:23S rRNA (uracil1939-C5)-methyltransferase
MRRSSSTSSSSTSSSVVPRCPHFEEGCGGCTLQHIAYPEQLRLKTALVDRLVRAAVPAAPAALPTVPSTSIADPWGYRHKVHFVFDVASALPGRRSAPHEGGRRKELVMGHYMRGSRRVLPVRECPVHDPRGNALAFQFRDALANVAESVKGIAIRVGAHTPEMMATLVVSRGGDRRLRSATRRAAEGPVRPTSLHVNVHPKADAFIFGPETRRITGPERMREMVAGVSFLISPTAFFQTNVAAAEILVQLVLDAVGDFRLKAEATPVLDLYAGAGLFALPLAKAGADVIAVEESRAAVADGEASLRLNRIPVERCRFIATAVERWRPPKGRRTDIAILDPPREGCTPAVIDLVFARVRPPRAVYISCNPEALARDLAQIAAHGYRIGSVQPVDMFPHTGHVETVVTLAR